MNATGDFGRDDLHERLRRELPSGIEIRTEIWDHRQKRVFGMVENLNFALRFLKNERKRELERADQRYKDLIETEWLPMFRDAVAVLEKEIELENDTEIRECLVRFGI